MNKSRLRLRGKISRSHGIEPEDTRSVKIALRDFGYYREPSFGITPYPDEQLFKGIENFQDDFDLQKDGQMFPGGETERKLNEVIGQNDPSVKSRPTQGPASLVIPRSSPSPGEDINPPSPNSSHDGREQHAALPAAIPVIVYEVAVFLGMSLSAAYALWLSLTADEKQQLRDQIQTYNEESEPDSATGRRCEALYDIDSATCRRISARRGPQAGQRCWASAGTRLGACLEGKSVDELPPLDVWNN
ncbi:MAG: hypothetical protein RLW87_23065 [Alphaproteobacteria bacterium]